MFEQDPHPLYKALLTQDYTLERSKDLYRWFDWRCSNYRLLVTTEIDSLHVLDPKTGGNVAFYKLDFPFYNQDDHQKNVFEAVKKYVDIIRESLNDINIKAMKLVLSEIILNYPEVQEIKFITNNKNILKNSKFLSQDNQHYQIEEENTLKLIEKFYFLKNFYLSSHFSIKDITYHEMMENFSESKEFQKERNLKIKIKKIT